MPNLRDAIEKAEAEKAYQVKLADQHFHVLLLPIFEEIAEAKKINMSVDPFKDVRSGLKGKLMKWWHSHEQAWPSSVPHSGGFHKSTGGTSFGTLVWETNSEEAPMTLYYWRYLEMGITHEGILIARFFPRLNILDPTHYQNLVTKVERLIVDKNGLSGSYQFERHPT